MADQSTVAIHTLNPIPNQGGQAPKMPSASRLNDVMRTYEFQGSKWAFKAPVGFKSMPVLKKITVQKGGNGDVENVVAYVLKNNRVVFEQTGGQLGQTKRYLGPVDYKTLPKISVPRPPMNPIPNR